MGKQILDKLSIIIKFSIYCMYRKFH